MENATVVNRVSLLNQENLLEFIDEEEIIKAYQERLDYLWEFNKPLEQLYGEALLPVFL